MSNARTNDAPRADANQSGDTSSTAGEIDMEALVAAVERLMRRDLELERERLRGVRARELW